MDRESESKSFGLQMISGLRALVGPPAGGGNAIDWSQMAIEYGHGFPDDYRAFMEVYGEGMFDDFLYVDPPVSVVYPDDPSSAVRGSTEIARYTAELQDFDEPDLLIAWGGTVEGDLLTWYACR